MFQPSMHRFIPCPSHGPAPQLKAALQCGHFQLSPSEVEQLAEQARGNAGSGAVVVLLDSQCSSCPAVACRSSSLFLHFRSVPVRQLVCLSSKLCTHGSAPNACSPQLDSQHSGTIDWSEWVAAMADWRPVSGCYLHFYAPQTLTDGSEWVAAMADWRPVSGAAGQVAAAYTTLDWLGLTVPGLRCTPPALPRLCLAGLPCTPSAVFEG